MRNNYKEVEEKEGKLFMGKEMDKERIQEVTGKMGRGGKEEEKKCRRLDGKKLKIRWPADYSEPIFIQVLFASAMFQSRDRSEQST